jgi:RNase P subunit RPR2
MRRSLRPDEPFAKFLFFKGLWERKYPGEKYLKTDKDLKYAKKLCEVDNAEIEKRARIYFKNKWYGENCRHNLAPFVTNFNLWVEEKHTSSQEIVIDCPVCGQKHRAHKPCPTSGKVIPMPDAVSQALTDLSKKMQVNK